MKEKLPYIAWFMVGIFMGFFLFIAIDEYRIDSVPTINCNCPEQVTCPEYDQEEIIKDCIKVLNDAETIKNLVNN